MIKRLYTWFRSVIDTLEWDECCQRLPAIPIHQHEPFAGWTPPAPEENTITVPGPGSIHIIVDPMFRPAPTDCRHEPPYPEHRTVMTALMNTDLVHHEPDILCKRESPHSLASCDLFHRAEAGSVEEEHSEV